MSSRSHSSIAIACVIAGYFFYSVADLCSKILQEHYSIHQVLAVSGSVGMVITGIWLATRHGLKSFIPPRMGLHMLRAVFVTGTAYFMVRSLHTLPLADFYGIVFIMPFLAMALAVMLLGEKVGWRRWAAAGVGFCGILILAGPQFSHVGEGVICAFLGAAFGAANIICLRKLGHGQPLPIYGFYPFLMITVTQVFMLYASNAVLPFRMEDAVYFGLHGPAIVFAILLVSTGFARARETAVVAPFHYTQIIWGVAFGWIFFDALPTTTTWAGLTLVAGAGLYSLWREYRRTHHIQTIDSP